MSDGSGPAQEPESMGWREHIQRMRRDFPSPWREEQADDAFENTFLRAVNLLDQMKPPRHFEGQEAWKGYLGTPALPDSRPPVVCEPRSSQGTGGGHDAGGDLSAISRRPHGRRLFAPPQRSGIGATASG